jgi:hypothetical protein
MSGPGYTLGVFLTSSRCLIVILNSDFLLHHVHWRRRLVFRLDCNHLEPLVTYRDDGGGMYTTLVHAYIAAQPVGRRSPSDSIRDAG